MVRKLQFLQWVPESRLKFKFKKKGGEGAFLTGTTNSLPRNPREKRQKGAEAPRADGESSTVPDAGAKLSPLFFGLGVQLCPYNCLEKQQAGAQVRIHSSHLFP